MNPFALLKKMSLLLLCCVLAVLCYGRSYEPGPNQTPAGDTTKKGVAPGKPDTSTAKPGQPVVQPAAPVLPRVESIQIFRSGSPDTTNPSRDAKSPGEVVYAGNIISFKISNAKIFLKSKPSDQAKVVLYANGIEMPGITSNWYSQATTMAIQQGTIPLPPDTVTINVQLVRNPASQGSWDFLYRNTEYFTDTYFDITHASIGWEHMSPLEKGAGNNSLTITFYKIGEFVLWSALYVVILIFFFWLAKSTDVLKATHTGPYSLSNTQLLFWTSLVMGAFIYTLLLTDISMSFNSSILYMLGISLGTTGIATAIDQNKIARNIATTKVPKSFLKDLLMDGDSYSVQRVQSFAWNLLLGLYFITYTIKNKTMPEFSSTMLLLAGFSSTSYVTGKLSENTTTAAAAQTAQANTTNTPVNVQTPAPSKGQ